MPFEVYPIQSTNESMDFAVENRSAGEVAQDIQQAYDNAEQKGGRVVASYILKNTAHNQQLPSEYLFLVAELPGQRQSDVELC